MSVYGDLSKAQRKLLAALFEQIPAARAVSAGRQRAVPIETAVRVDAKGRQTAGNLKARGLVDHDDGFWRPRVWLTPAGLDLMRSLDFRHSRASVIR